MALDGWEIHPQPGTLAWMMLLTVGLLSIIVIGPPAEGLLIPAPGTRRPTARPGEGVMSSVTP